MTAPIVRHYDRVVIDVHDRVGEYHMSMLRHFTETLRTAKPQLWSRLAETRK